MNAPGFDVEWLKQRVRTVPDWPTTGVMFRDITPLLQDALALRALAEAFVQRYRDARIALVAAIDARGFIIGAVVAHQLAAGLIPIRKKGKLPAATIARNYELEYGTGTIEMHVDAARAGERVLLIDDLIATGGTMLAACALLDQLDVNIVECAVVIDLPDLGGSCRLRDAGRRVFSLMEFAGH